MGLLVIHVNICICGKWGEGNSKRLMVNLVSVKVSLNISKIFGMLLEPTCIDLNLPNIIKWILKI